ncbi:MAG: MerR family transcriptional regulator [Anaerolineales bacterium]|nr:MerR family transcriptional regulator [Anaerolineales bacterium]
MDASRYLRTSELARAAGIHPNTVRLYEEWGLLPPVERNPFNNYRRYTHRHLDQLLLVRSALQFTLLGGAIRASAYEIIEEGVQGNHGGALELAYKLLAQILSEQTQAEAAVNFLERWAAGTPTEPPRQPLRIGDTARLLEVSIDQLHNWERNGLIQTPRDPHNGYRQYGPDEIGRLRVIRMLLRARYSTMSILRMFTKLDAGEKQDLRTSLDTPESDEDVLYVTDHWLTTLAELEQAARALVKQIETLLAQKN